MQKSQGFFKLLSFFKRSGYPARATKPKLFCKPKAANTSSNSDDQIC